MILSDFIGHRSFIQGNLQSEEEGSPVNVSDTLHRVNGDDSDCD